MPGYPASVICRREADVDTRERLSVPTSIAVREGILRVGGVAAAVLLTYAGFRYAPHVVGMLSAHMIMHIALMSVLAPAIAIAIGGRSRLPGSVRDSLASATALQLGVFLAWHTPAGLEIAMASAAAQFAMHTMLLVSAIWFWRAVIATARSAPWWAAGALILTGKIVCLVAALLVFAPRLLYSAMAATPTDQQLAGLIMLVACPATYIGAATVIVARWLFGSSSGACPHPRAPALE